MTQRVLMTGGTGFIGCHVSAELWRRGSDLVLFDMAPDLEALKLVAGPEAAAALKVIAGDVSSAVDVFRAVHDAQPDLIIHLASPNFTEASADSVVRRMIGGHINVLEAARLWKVSKVVWSSATSVFGSPKSHGGVETVISNNAPHHPYSLYGIGKSTCERLAEFYRTRYEVDVLGLRFVQGYGPGKKRGRPFGYELFRRALAGEPYEVPFGDDLINWQFVEDISKLILSAADSRRSSPVTLNTTGEVLTMSETVDLMRAVCPQAKLTLGSGTNDITWRYDVSELRRLIGDFRVTPAREGFSQTLATMAAWQRHGHAV